MITRLAYVSVLVRDYDEALRWYTEALGLEVRSDMSFEQGFRWVTVGAPGQPDVSLVLHCPMSPGQAELVGRMGMGVLHSDDCRGDVERFRERGVKITGEPQEMPWGIQAVFEDLYGNGWVLVQPPSDA